MKALVLGVNGVTGRAIAHELTEAGWEVTGTGRDPGRFPRHLAAAGVQFARSDRREPSDLAACLGTGADVVIDCVCYTAAQARLLLDHRGSIGSAVVLSSKAVYVDDHGRHSNSELPPDFGGPVGEGRRVLEPDFSGAYDSPEGYGRNKVAAEVVLSESDLPVSVLRPSRIHGPGGSRPREWFIVRRLLDGRQRIPLAHDGRTGNHPTAAANLARLTRVCAENPGERILNAADPGTPSAREVVASVSHACGIPTEVVGLPDDAPEGDGWSPWATWPPFYLDTSAAEAIGYRAVGSYTETVTATVRWLLELTPEERAHLDADPYFTGLFDYRHDDEAMDRAAHRSDSGRQHASRSRGRKGSDTR